MCHTLIYDKNQYLYELASMLIFFCIKKKNVLLNYLMENCS